MIRIPLTGVTRIVIEDRDITHLVQSIEVPTDVKGLPVGLVGEPSLLSWEQWWSKQQEHLNED